MEAGSPRLGCQHGLVRAFLGVADFKLLAVASHGGRGRGAVTDPFCRALILYHLQRLHLLIPSHWALGLQHENLGGDTNIQTISSHHSNKL